MAAQSVRLVSLQFSFSNQAIVPSSVKRLEAETPEERNERKSRASGVRVIKPIHNVSLVAFLDDLKKAGYEMINASYKPRLDDRNRTFHMVRFLFCRREYVDISNEFRETSAVLGTELQEICRQAAWRVRAFINPFYENGERVAGQITISINLEARNPLLRSDGQPVMAWQKEQGGERIGDAPIPLKPDYHLRLEDTVIKFTTEQ